MLDLIFYSIPWDGPTVGIVQSGGHTYELRDNGYGGYGAFQLSDEELEQHGSNMIELDAEESGLNLGKVLEALSLAANIQFDEMIKMGQSSYE